MVTSAPIHSYFGDAVLRAGFMPVPNLLHRHWRELGLQEETFVFLLHLLSIVWDTNAPPQSLPDIAERMGRDVRTVRRHSNQLNQLGLVIIRERSIRGRRIGNDYDLSPLWDRLAALVERPDEDEGDIELGPPIPVEPDGGGDQDMGGVTWESDDDSWAPAIRAPMSVTSTPVSEARTPMSEARTPMSVTRTLMSTSHPPMSVTGTPMSTSRPPMSESRASTSGSPRTSMPRTTRTPVQGLKRNQEDFKEKLSEEAAAAAALFGQWMAITDARALVKRFPACVPHALALAEEISRPHVANPAGLLHRLVERGWTPPARPATPALNADDPFRFLRNGATGRCMLCDEPLEVCGGIHLPAWAREPAHPEHPPGWQDAPLANLVAADNQQL